MANAAVEPTPIRNPTSHTKMATLAGNVCERLHRLADHRRLTKTRLRPLASWRHAAVQPEIHHHLAIDVPCVTEEEVNHPRMRRGTEKGFVWTISNIDSGDWSLINASAYSNEPAIAFIP